jgi:hypothetical protein
MKSKTPLHLIILFILFAACGPHHDETSSAAIGHGQMPDLVVDHENNLHLVFGNGDSILYAQSVDQGKSFSTASLVAIVPKLVATAMRGPQIAATKSGITILACDHAGDIFSFLKDASGIWVKTARVNDVDTVAKEGLMDLSGDGNNLFSVWLDLRGNKHNKIVGARSGDGGKSWSSNMLIYASSDSTVCECCKPSVVEKGDYVFVMFRNWVNGNRDLYLIQSADGGKNFGAAEKLGNGSWALNGCPMDGGGIIINTNNIPQTVWRRQNKIFSCEAGKPETEIGEGKNCGIESVNGKNVYVWTQNGEVICVLPEGIKKNLGKGKLPIVKAINNEHIICVWENEKQVHKAVIEL